MDTLGLALIVCGTASLCSGLIFLLPGHRGPVSSVQSVEQSIDEIDSYLQQMRGERGEL